MGRLRLTLQWALESAHAPFCYRSQRGSNISALFLFSSSTNARISFLSERTIFNLSSMSGVERSYHCQLLVFSSRALFSFMESSGHDGHTRKLLSDSHV